MTQDSTTILCGVKHEHEHDDKHVSLEMFDGRVFLGPKEELQEEIRHAKMWSRACSVCGSSAFNRDVYYGLE